MRRIRWNAYLLSRGYPPLPKGVRVFSSPLAGHLLAFWHMEAITIRNTIIVGKASAFSPALIRHELVHVKQWKRLGAFKFLYRYTRSCLKYGYHQNPFELEAQLAEKKPSRPK